MIQLAVGDFYRMEYEAMREWGERALAAAQDLSRSAAHRGEHRRAGRRRRVPGRDSGGKVPQLRGGSTR